MKETEIRNALIDGVTLSCEDHGLLSAWLHLDYGDCGHQSFGGFSLYLPKSWTHHQKGAGYAGHFIFRCMEIAGVTNWDKVKGKTIRVKKENGLIVAIGHIVKDDWFCPTNDFS